MVIVFDVHYRYVDRSPTDPYHFAYGIAYDEAYRGRGS